VASTFNVPSFSTATIKRKALSPRDERHNDAQIMNILDKSQDSNLVNMEK
jgi:hypothetical protein